MATIPADTAVLCDITAGQPLPSTWTVSKSYTVANGGPGISTLSNAIKFSVTNMAGNNQWVQVTNNAACSVARGAFRSFKIRITTVSNTSESKLHVGGNTSGKTWPILRTANGAPSWCWWNDATGFTNLSNSAITAGSGWHDVLVAYSPGQITLFEDGIVKWTWANADQEATIQPSFWVQALDRGANLDMDISDIIIAPAEFKAGVSGRFDYPWPNSPVQLTNWTSERTSDANMKTTYQTGLARVAATPLKRSNMWTYFDWPRSANAPTNTTVLMNFPIRVNTAQGSETKITFPGDNILRLTSAGTVANWCTYVSDAVGFKNWAASSIRGGATTFTNVTLVYDPAAANVHILENGKFVVSYPKPAPGIAPSCYVQHLDAGSNVSVDIGTVRTVPSFFV